MMYSVLYQALRRRCRSHPRMPDTRHQASFFASTTTSIFDSSCRVFADKRDHQSSIIMHFAYAVLLLGCFAIHHSLVLPWALFPFQVTCRNRLGGCYSTYVGRRGERTSFSKPGMIPGQVRGGISICRYLFFSNLPAIMLRIASPGA